MPAPTVIIDLSNVAFRDGEASWKRVEAVVRAWLKRDRSAVVLGIADNSLYRHLDHSGRQRLNDWKRTGRARSVSFADPEILRAAEANPGAVIITTDEFRDLRRDFPWLQSTDRVIKAVLHDSGVQFIPIRFASVADDEISLRKEEADLKPRGIDTPEAREALEHEWACTSAACDVWGSSEIIDADPAFRHGEVRCPACDAAATRVGPREHTREVVVTLGEHEIDRVPVGEDSTLLLGRQGGRARYDVRHVLEGAAAGLVSRDHLLLTNRGGQLRAEDPGSKNGSTLIPKSGGRSPLQPGVQQILSPGDRIELAGGAMTVRLSGRRRPRGRYAPDLATAPWEIPSPETPRS